MYVYVSKSIYLVGHFLTMVDKTVNLKANNLMILKNVKIKKHIFLSSIFETYEVLYSIYTIDITSHIYSIYTIDITSHIVYLFKIVQP